MKRIENNKLFFVDCDETLVHYLSDFSDNNQPTVSIQRVIDKNIENVIRVPNQHNIALVKKFAELGYGIVIWSQSGSDWAQDVSEAVGLDKYVTLYLTKPGGYYLDDLPCQEWMGKRIWRDPISGEDR